MNTAGIKDEAGDDEPKWLYSDCARSFSVAAYENFVRVIKYLKVVNISSVTLYDLTVTVEASPKFVQTKTWKIDKLHPEEEYVLPKRDLHADSDYLRGLNEAERGELCFTLKAQGKELAVLREEIRVLARDEWGGSGCEELLAAFVAPNDPALTGCLLKASKILSESNESPSLEGYQSGNPKRAFLQASAIWSAMTAEGLVYSNPPRSFETSGQKIRRPEFVLGNKLATCLDTTLLFASAFEQIGLNPVIVLQREHCFVGFWLRDQRFDRPLMQDVTDVRKAIVANELRVFETTLVTEEKKVCFEQALKAGFSLLQEPKAAEFIAAIDISRARMAKIRPLASHSREQPGAESNQDSLHAPLGDVPEFPPLGEDHVEFKPSTPKGRIDRWQRKLLDLSKRNRLLNFRDTKQTVQVLAPDVSKLEDVLASGKRLKLISSSQKDIVDGRDEEWSRRKTGSDALEEFVAEAWHSKEIVVPLSEKEMVGRLTKVFRAAKSDMVEGGSNTLFLAIGFLRWKEKPEDERAYKAPLLLIPVKLTRRSANSAYKLSLHEDEVRFNSTLIQMLQQDFDLDFSKFEAELPTDDCGVDVPLVMSDLRNCVRDVPGFEVVEDMAISTFSFAKYLMWKDLVDRLDQLEKNPVVRHLINNPDRVYRASDRGEMPRGRDIDTHFKPSELYHPLDADSSQLAAVMAAAKGQDFVLIGPPGTGKSQTIANMIAQCLAEKKTVLFVAEKTAALNVVYRRLKQRGLGECCVELHSNKSERRQFLKQMKNCWETKSSKTKNVWDITNSKLENRRDELNEYVAALHREYENGWTAYEAMGLCALNASVDALKINWDPNVKHDVARFQLLTDSVKELHLAFSQVEFDNALIQICQTSWSVSWEKELIESTQAFKDLTPQMRASTGKLIEELGVPAEVVRSVEDLNRLRLLCASLLELSSSDTRLLFHKQVAKLPDIARKCNAEATQGLEALKALEERYSREVLPKIPTAEFDIKWREANAKFWPLSVIAKWSVNRLLATYSLNRKVDASNDLKNVEIYQSVIKNLEGKSLERYTSLWKGIETNFADLGTLIKELLGLRYEILKTGNHFKCLETLSKQLSPALKTPHSSHSIYNLAAGFLTQFEEWNTSLQHLENVAGTEVSKSFKGRVFDEAETFASSVISNRRKLQRWASWCAVKSKALELNLDFVVHSLEENEVDVVNIVNAFNLAYAQWWLATVIDQDPILRSFQKYIHENSIKEFCELDERARGIAADRVLLSIQHDLPKPEDVPRSGELGLLRHQMNLKRPSKSIRSLIESMPSAFSQLAPCVLMSPLSIAQYLPADHSEFDVVIFDEASQIPTWDAIGAIARGRQTIVVGDPKQLPPTNFFGRNDSDVDDEFLEDYEKDLESILDETKASGLPVLQLKWHYRSRHESLISFSNKLYYNNRLITFPAADNDELGVKFIYAKDAPYDRGVSRTNPGEANLIVAELVQRMKIELSRPEEVRLTFGAVTFNQTQQSLIQDLLDQEQVLDSSLEWYFSEERIEPTVVKNLENVQGDERDVMMFSVTYGKDKAGVFYRNFGALNRDGGERRLNVAVTRSRRLLLVFSSIKGEDLDVSGLKSQGVNDLKTFLEYAEHGEQVLRATVQGSVGEVESPLEESVLDSLKKKGWDVVPQVGVSGFRIDLGIRHPDHPGKYLAGVECDGATYHRSVSARDRDKTRELVLRGLGWEIIRIWSPDWWYNQADALKTVDDELNSLLSKSRGLPEREVEDPEDNLQSPALNVDEKVVDSRTSESQLAVSNGSLFDETVAGEEPVVSEQDVSNLYKEFDTSVWQIDPNSFYERSYVSQLRSMVEDLVSAEGPIHEDVIAKKVARAHGWMRTGKKIRARVSSALRNITWTKETTGKFYWGSDEPSDLTSFRHSPEDAEQRPIDEISISEIRGFINENDSYTSCDDPAGEIARDLGYGRVTVGIRKRINEALG